MNRSTSLRGLALPAAAVVLALVAIIAVVASGALGRVGDPGTSPRPSDRPSPAPPATPGPTATPSDEPADGVFRIDLANATDDDVSVVVDDRTGTVVDASSGEPGDGMSVRWFDMTVENVDAKTLRLTWVGLPVDEEAELFVSYLDGKLRLRMVQASPPLNSDAVGFDRILILRFDTAVATDDVLYSFQASLDTAD